MILPIVSINNIFRYDVDNYGNICTIDRDLCVKYSNFKGNLLNQLHLIGSITNMIYFNNGKLYYNIKEIKEGTRPKVHLYILDLISEKTISEFKDHSIIHKISQGVLAKNINDNQLVYLDFQNSDINWKIDYYENRFSLEGISDSSLYCFSLIDMNLIKKIGIIDGKEIWRFSTKDFTSISSFDLSNENFQNTNWYIQNELLYVNLKSGKLLVLDSKSGEFVKCINNVNCNSGDFYIPTTKRIGLKLSDLGLMKIGLDNENSEIHKLEIGTKAYEVNNIIYTDAYVFFKSLSTNDIYNVDLNSFELIKLKEVYKIDTTKNIKSIYIVENHICIIYTNDLLEIFNLISPNNFV